MELPAATVAFMAAGRAGNATAIIVSCKSIALPTQMMLRNANTTRSYSQQFSAPPSFHWTAPTR